MRIQRKQNSSGQVAKVWAHNQPGLIAKMVQMRCPECQTLQNYGNLFRTNPPGWINYWQASECPNCKAWLYLEAGNMRYAAGPISLLFFLSLIAFFTIIVEFIGERFEGLVTFLFFVIFVSFFLSISYFQIKSDKVKVIDRSKMEVR